MKAAQAVENTAEVEIHRLIEDWQQAILDHDHARIAAFYAPDVRAFDAVEALQVLGRDAYHEAWRKGFEYLNGGRMVFELADVRVVAGGDVAFSSGLVRCGGISAEGVEESGWMRYTGCWRRQGGRWLVAHEHFSVPFSMQTMQPLFDLKP